MRSIILLVLFAIGCRSTVQDPIADSVANYNADNPDLLPTIKADTDEIKSALTEQTGLLIEIKETLKASLVKSEPKQLGGDQASALRPPEKHANDSQPVDKIVAEPGAASRVASDGTRLRWNIEGDWNPTILETSAHLRQDHGIDTDGMTHQEMADIHAAIHDGKPVAMRSKPVQFVNRGFSCPGGVCPTARQVSVRRRR